MAKRDRVLRGRATEGLGKAKSDILGAFAVAERMMGALDRFLSPQDEEDVADPEAAPEPPRTRKVDARVVGKKPDGTFEVVVHDPQAVRRRR